MKSFKQYISEELISPSKEPNTMSFYHGGNLEYGPDENFNHSKGRLEFGPGIYCTTHYSTAQKYSKGNRKLYLLTIEKGNDANDSRLPIKESIEFVNYYVLKAKRKEILEALNKRNKEGLIDADVFLNIIVNYEGIKASNSNALRKFFVSHNIDYVLVSNAFGWGEMMIVLFNMKKIVNIKRINPKDKIEEYELPTSWNK